MISPETLNIQGSDYLPGHLGIVVTEVDKSRVSAEFRVSDFLMAPNGYLHAGGVVTLADTCCGYGTLANLPEGASGFTTVELKSNHLSTARQGIVTCTATPSHVGKTTQVWDAVVSHKDTGKTMALFRCTQVILYQ